MGSRTTHVEQRGGFASGIVSKRYWYNPKLPHYQTGLDEATNVWTSPAGALSRRPGTIAELDPWDSSHATGRLIPWKLASGQQVLVSLDGDNLAVDATGNEGLRENVVVNPEFDAGFYWWGTAVPIAEYPWEIRAVSGDNYAMGYTAISTGYPLPINSLAIAQFINIPQANDSLDIVFRLAAALAVTQNGADTFFPQKVRITLFEGTTLNTPVWSTDITPPVPTSIENPTPISYTLRAALSPAIQGTYTIHVQLVDIVYPPGVNGFVWVPYLQLFGMTIGAVTGSATTTPQFAHPWEDEALLELQYIQNPYEDQLVFVHESQPVQELTYSGGTWAFQPVAYPADEAPNFGTAGAYPAACGSFQGRLILGGSPERRQTVWGSKPGKWREFKLNDTNPTPADGIEFTLAKVGNIHWIYGHKNLLIGTQDAEWLVTSDGGVLAPGDIDARIQTTHGSRYRMAQPAGHQIFYTTPNGTELRSADLRRDNAGWVAENHSYWVGELLQARLHRIVYVRDPWPHLLCVTDTGKLLVMNYDQGLADHGLPHQGWFLWDFPGAHVIDACVTREEGKDRVRVIVGRNDTEGYRIHRFLFTGPDQFNKDFGRGNYYVDGGRIEFSDTPASTWRVPGHMVGLQVYAWHGTVPNQISGPHLVEPHATDAGYGQVVTPVTSQGIVYGILYESRMKTLPLDRFASDTGHASVRSYSRVGLRLLSSDNPEGFDMEPDRKPLSYAPSMIQAQTTTVPSEIPSGPRLYEKQLLGQNRTGQLLITQKWPTNLCIVTVFGKAEMGDD